MSRLFSLLPLIIGFAGVAPLHAQPFTIGTLPRAQTAANSPTTFTIHVHADSTYSAAINFRGSIPSLPGASLLFSKYNINYPYNDVTLTVTLTGRKAVGTYAVVIEAYNGPTVASDTVRLSIASVSAAWQVFDIGNSPLPSNLIRTIAVDHNGVGWIGTDKGLASFDGTHWTLHDSTNGFLVDYTIQHHSKVDGIAVDSSNNVWVLTPGALHRFSNHAWTNQSIPRFVYDENLPAEHIAADRNGRILIAGDNVLASIDDNTWKLDTISNRMRCLAVAVDGAGSVWLVEAARTEIARFDGTYWTDYEANTIANNVFGGGFRPGMLVRDPQGNIWSPSDFGAVRGIAKFEGKGWTGVNRDLDKFPGPGPQAMAFDTTGRIWVANDGGLIRFDGTNSTLYTADNSGLPESYLISIAAGNNNRIWIGTAAHGLAIIDGNTDPDRLYSSVGNDRASGNANGSSSIQPNPATSTARFAYTVQTAAHVRIELYDALGMHVFTVADAQMEAGSHDATINTQELVAGTYFVKLSAGNIVEARPLIVVH
ncbi:MAG TPA: two-component regulator propeller domain-containing protein [Candidatus Kapabacteria bacterium]|nr:two-component regulator propeller domain-containing protein [Candidatus Kapabacteria bacterium]